MHESLIILPPSITLNVLSSPKIVWNERIHRLAHVQNNVFKYAFWNIIIRTSQSTTLKLNESIEYILLLCAMHLFIKNQEY